MKSDSPYLRASLKMSSNDKEMNAFQGVLKSERIQREKFAEK
jgi:hypothetical protein